MLIVPIIGTERFGTYHLKALYYRTDNQYYIER